MTEQTAIQKVSTYLHKDEITARFAEIVGAHNAAAYITSVLIAVANSDELQKCGINSIYTSAIRAASLRLSVDPATKQAYLVPFGKAATLIVGYKGMYDMAVRTGKYRYINVAPIYEGMTVTPHPISGIVTLAGLGGAKKSDKIIGWLGSFEMLDGFAHTLYMTVEECQAHGKQYSKTYRSESSPWKKEAAKMEQKTVLRLLLSRWGYLDPVDMMTLKAIEEEPVSDILPNDDAIDAILKEEGEQAKKSENTLMAELGFGTDEPQTAEQPKLV